MKVKPQMNTDEHRLALAKTQNPQRIQDGRFRIVAAYGVLKKWLQEKTNPTFHFREKRILDLSFPGAIFSGPTERRGNDSANSAPPTLLAFWRLGGSTLSAFIRVYPRLDLKNPCVSVPSVVYETSLIFSKI
jgi:hypothetical protein